MDEDDEDEVEVAVHLQKLLENIFQYFSFNELRRFRLISKVWNDNIILYTSSKQINNIIIHKNWVSKIENHPKDLMTQWTSITLDHIIIRTNPFFTNIWPSISRRVTSITLKNINNMTCRMVCNFLHECPALQDVTLIKLSFQIHTGHGPPNDPGVPAANGNPNTFVCRHTNIPNRINHFRAQNLKKISIQNIPVIPICILDYLLQSTTGNLNKFEYLDSEWEHEKRILIAPTLEQMLEYVSGIIQKNIQNIRNFTWKNITSGERFLNRLFNPFNPRLHMQLLTKLILVQPNPISGTEGTDPYLDFLERLWLSRHIHGLQELELTIYNSTYIGRLQQLLHSMNNLLKLTITILSNPVVSNPPLIFQQIQTLTHLKHLSISDKSASPHLYPCISNRWLILLPKNIKYLSFDLNDGRHEIETIQEFLRMPVTHLLTKLAILNGSIVNDEIMQQIIINLQQLQDLTINNSKVLSDVGITGWPMNIIEYILRTTCYTPMFHNFEYNEKEAGRNINELTHLRRLNLKGCEKLSDISIHSFKFPYLREINVSHWFGLTDIGLVWLVEKNPCLEYVVCKNVRKISTLGINELILQSKFKISNIQISQVCMKRKFGNMGYEKCREFDKYVTVSKQDD